jgi:hypothetical protein
VVIERPGTTVYATHSPTILANQRRSRKKPLTNEFETVIYDMSGFRMRFIVGITEAELLALTDGEQIISKMLLIPDDYKVFHYREGDNIEAETPEGNRMWVVIRNMEVIEDQVRTIVILTLAKQTSKKKDNV